MVESSPFASVPPWLVALVVPMLIALMLIRAWVRRGQARERRRGSESPARSPSVPLPADPAEALSALKAGRTGHV